LSCFPTALACCSPDSACFGRISRKCRALEVSRPLLIYSFTFFGLLFAALIFFDLLPTCFDLLRSNFLEISELGSSSFSSDLYYSAPPPAGSHLFFTILDLLFTFFGRFPCFYLLSPSSTCFGPEMEIFPFSRPRSSVRRPDSPFGFFNRGIFAPLCVWLAPALRPAARRAADYRRAQTSEREDRIGSRPLYF